ncbi:unnamed protein product, partial [Schistosoma curassoni]|uniref:Transposase n=1 Tax=Schistosoma curassoni TaxID=6186 RepID=A0A183L5I1_9TREM
QWKKAAKEGSIKQLYDTTKKLASNYSKPERPVKDKKGKTITEIQEQRNRWVEYFEDLLNRPATVNPLDIEAPPTDLPVDVTSPTIEEIMMSIRQIKSEKVAGLDYIPSEPPKSDIEVTSRSSQEEQVSTDCKERHLIKTPKEGNLSKYENYRGITLLSVTGKVFNSVAELDERLSRFPVSRSIGRIP